MIWRVLMVLEVVLVVLEVVLQLLLLQLRVLLKLPSIPGAGDFFPSAVWDGSGRFKLVLVWFWGILQSHNFFLV